MLSEITKVKTTSISKFNLTFNFSTTKDCNLELFYITLQRKRKLRSHVSFSRELMRRHTNHLVNLLIRKLVN